MTKHRIALGSRYNKNRPKYEVECVTRPDGLVEAWYEGRVVADGADWKAAVLQAAGYFQSIQPPRGS